MSIDSNRGAIVVRVPASTSNLGPGLDCLGLALTLYNDFTVKRAEGGQSIFEGRGACAGIDAKKNPFMEMFSEVCRLAGKTAPAIEATADGQVPMGAGLGSSATARVAGALAANHLLHGPFTREQLLVPLVAAEEHPDNVTPCLLGGLSVSAIEDGGAPFAHIYEPHGRWRYALLVPDYTLSTSDMRKLLPRKVPLADALFNLARVPLLLDAWIAGDMAMLGRACQDRLHEAQRSEHVKRGRKIRRAALEAGAAACFVSGSGPVICAVCDGEEGSREVMKAMERSCEGAKFGVRGVIAEADLEGARIAEVD